ncbi:Protein of unknown function (DUF3754) [Seminavis robusta]|uniref:Uncharacterized protein n=1 Tax=Seminavis robusta TaxID=568900 RepID=A0A9N8HDK5_9STRA|nr:Protein of unknown function (DUF3754) [Seminavis robusta]|eukprot:Sro464_g148400.1 Protein of unknown function (DUF3754) (804) ;mRNA; r:39770-42281
MRQFYYVYSCSGKRRGPERRCSGWISNLFLLWLLILPLTAIEAFVPVRHHAFTPVASALRNGKNSFNDFFDKGNRDEDGNNNEKEKAENRERIRDILVNGDVDDAIFPPSINTVIPKFKVLVKNNNTNNQTNNGFQETNNGNSIDTDKKKKKKKKHNPIAFSCRIVTSSDGKIPTQQSALPPSLYQPPQILAKLDAIYHATVHEQTRFIKFMDQKSTDYPTTTPQDEAKVISILRSSLEDAGFELLTRRDLDLCQALNAEYLLRLSILEDLKELDPSIATEFYPEEEELQSSNTTSRFLYNGRVLVFWRGYGQEITRGRLLLPKIDYLQASIVQRAASGIRVRLNIWEETIATNAREKYYNVETAILSTLSNLLIGMNIPRLAKWATLLTDSAKERQRETSQQNKERVFKLQRYGGYRSSFASSVDALTPFTICEVDYGDHNNNNKNATRRVNQTEHDLYDVMNCGQLTCQYDEEISMQEEQQQRLPPMQLLERVSISNLIDFATMGPKSLLKTIVAKNELMEPTYREVIVVWRPLPPKPAKPVFTPPKFAYDVADMFDLKGLPELPCAKETPIEQPPMEIRAFASVPMANLPAVLPKTKLVFRPADAFVFDAVSIVSLLLVISSQRFDNPRLDLLALVSFSLWIFRTVIRYSNKLARYDLLVKKFLTSKITHRNSGAVKYVTTEAGSYRATRAALVYTWLRSPMRVVTSRACNDRDQLVQDGLAGVNALIKGDKQVKVDIEAALRDLEDVDLIHFSANGRRLESVVRDSSSVVAALGEKWAGIFEGETTKPIEITSWDGPRP